MELTTAFGLALKHIRNLKNLTQEDFSVVSSRTYLSSLERGLKGATIEKVDQLAGVLGVHPATLLIATYLEKDGLIDGDLDALLVQIKQELQDLRVD
ncbi:helix-turn-helix domain-containing protein [Pseudomonas sichuanensis]|uniref:helix-turn-helix domain-containing protein n=1 Tax=Pseudomonas sichuanensis TaxID=2213015 RepID=UPI00215EEE61|nr:helix-turn-helix transcriptional regulator [Pseudomonas sichuanensis]UVL89468.1 helix-turn-helix domain-containing protein [Pseudomonas sichuanensis]